MSGPEGGIITRPAQRRLLAILLLGPDSGTDRDVLIDRMWAFDRPGSARNALQVHIAAIRKSAPGLITTTSTGYGIDLESCSCDLFEFRLLGDQARAMAADGDWSGALVAGERALGLWRGQPFDPLANDDFAQPEQARLTELHLGLIELRVQSLLSLGQVETAVPELELLVHEHPLRERLWEYLMLGRYRLGRQADALRAFREASLALGDELGIEPGPRLRALEEEILLGTDRHDQGGRSPTPHNLPRSTTSFVGREGDLEGVAGLLEQDRSVTITGGPGLGKSRLAIEVARASLDAYPGGVWFVDLGSARESSDVAATIASALGSSSNVPTLDVLARQVALRPALLIMDACDHVHGETRLFMQTVADHGGLIRIISTARRPITGLPGPVWRLGALDLPSESITTAHAPAMRLLVDRASALDPVLRFDDRRSELIELCRRTQGIPLAIELAARWIPSLDPAVRVDLPDVGDALRASIDWSLRLLAASDRSHVFAASVFEGPITFQSLQSVGAPVEDEVELSGIVARLVESALLRTEPSADGRVTYSMPEAIREFCRETTSPDALHALEDRHAAWHASPASLLTLSNIREPTRSLPDFRKSMRRLVDGGAPAAAARLAIALGPVWDSHYLTWEASRWVEEILGLVLDEATRTELAWAAGWAAYNNHDYALARARYEEALELARSTSDKRSVARSLFGLGRIEQPMDPVASEILLTSALDAFREIESDGSAEAGCLTVLGLGRAWGGDSATGRRQLETALDMLGPDGDPRGRSICKRYLSLCSFHDDDRPTAIALADEAYEIARDAGDRRALGGALIQRALIEGTWGDPAMAAHDILEALDPIPEIATIDLSLIAFGALPALISTGSPDLAADVFGAIDGVFDQHGWMRIERRSPLAAALRSQTPPTERALPWSLVEPRLTAALVGLSGR